MKQGWKIKKLRDISEYFNGLTYTPKDVSDDGVIVLRSSNIQNEKLDFSDIVRVNAKVKDKLFVNEGDILMCSRNGSKHLVGKTAPILDIKEHMTFGTFMMIIRSEYNPYLLWFFKTDDFKRQISGGENTMINQVTRYMLDEITLPFPPANEQERIVGILDSAFAKIEALRANTQQNLQNAKDLFQASLKQELTPKQGWKTQKLDAIAEITSSKRIYKDEYVKDGVPFYRTKEIKELANGQNISLELFISAERYQEIKNKFGVPLIGDILISAVGTIGEILVIQDESEFYFKDGNIIWIKGISKTTSLFLSYNLKSIIEQLKSITIGAAYSALTIEKFKQMKISFPIAHKEQQSIVEKLNALNERCRVMEENYRQTIAHCNALKQALLKKAFNGEL